jgi:hypothetical protein
MHTIIEPRPESLVSLREQVEFRLRQSRYAPLRRVRCDDRGGALRLFGRLPSHYLKQVALATVSQVTGSTPLIIEIVVERASQPEGSGTSR